MTTILNLLIQSYKKVFGLIVGSVIFGCYYLIRKTSNLEINNKNLMTDLEDLNIEAEKVIAIQRKQMDIASRPPLSPELLHEWMRSTKDIGPE